MKLDDESSDDSLLVMQVPTQVENEVQVEENVDFIGQVESQVQVQENDVNGQVENQVQVQENVNRVAVNPVDSEILSSNGLATQIFEKPGSTDRQCRAYIEAKERHCARKAISNDIYCCAHFSSKKRKCVDVRINNKEEIGLSTNQYFHGEPSRNNNNNNKELIEVDEPVAVWFKLECGEKWNAGIKCARADWPLSIIRGKPTNDNQNKYFVIFSPETRNYLWVDMLRVQLINEFPQPMAYETHQDGIDIVQDLNIARQFIMQKLAGDMLHLVHLIHYNALIESARHVIVWKQFGMEAYNCHTYSELGRMVKKLQNNIMQQYIKANWKLHSYKSWAERCKKANNADAIEQLQEELYRSILWKDVRALWNAPMQPKLDYEWETWKHDVMKCFVTFPSFCSNNGTHQRHASSSNNMRQVCSENHTEEAQWLFRGYSCALCFDYFTYKKLLETHVQERHRVQFEEHLLLLLCIPCGRHFDNTEELRLHFMSAHHAEFKLLKAREQVSLSTGDDCL
ncbi:histone-lysine N-methyltransferase SUVR5 [Trifolium repens]|nr:histone-lysine N-methyltransferase SUVR5 [Trifolium repens]